MRTPAFLLGAAAALLPACGAKVTVDGTTGAAGAAGTGGAASSSSSGAGGTTLTTTTTTSSGTGGSAGGCPDPFPGIEAPCPTEGQTCAVPLACCGGQAFCTNGFWMFAAQPCAQPCSLDCGPNGFSCGLGGTCVAYIGMTATTYECRPSPCPGDLACSCAEMLCQEEGLTCNNIQQGFKVLCD
jgi:hypothetical protein